MERTWYWAISIIMILALSMSGHAWSQSVPVWSIILRTLHLAGISLWLGINLFVFFSIYQNEMQLIYYAKSYLK